MTTRHELDIRDAVFAATPELALTNLRGFASAVAREMVLHTDYERGYEHHVYDGVYDCLLGEQLEPDEVADYLIDEAYIMEYEDWKRDVYMDEEDRWDDD